MPVRHMDSLICSFPFSAMSYLTTAFTAVPSLRWWHCINYLKILHAANATDSLHMVAVDSSSDYLGCCTVAHAYKFV
jgi:hypothetical protein